MYRKARPVTLSSETVAGSAAVRFVPRVDTNSSTRICRS
jgi:hypothetical protein